MCVLYVIIERNYLVDGGKRREGRGRGTGGRGEGKRAEEVRKVGLGWRRV